MTEDVRDHFPANLADAMTARQFDALKLALLIDVTPGSVDQWLRGDTFPCPRHVLRLATVLRVPTEQLLSCQS